jgi:1-hydroxycarotenoid 3,4-desaturase
VTARRVVVVGAGIGGLVAALDLAASGARVTVFEKAPAPGGKMRELCIDGIALDAGPTVFTMRWVFEALFADLGLTLSDHLAMRPLELLARHTWSDSARLDLFTDLERTVEAIGDFCGSAEARRYRRFNAHARRVYRTLEQPFIRASRPGPLSLVRASGLRGLGDLWQIKPFTRLWNALGSYFHDPRLRQLFGRYATYCGSSPFQAPATLMLIAHVEQQGVWLIDGGMHRLAAVLAALGAERGVDFRYGAEVAEITVSAGRANAIKLASGESFAMDAIVLNADPAALGAGMFGPQAARAVPQIKRTARSLSAVTWNLLAETEGFPLQHHNVFFSADYAAEFDDIIKHGRLPAAPTVYVCAQDRGACGSDSKAGAERLLCLVNAPATGDSIKYSANEIGLLEQRSFALLENCGLRVMRRPEATLTTTPDEFERLFPATGGALYGQASHGWRASFSRPGARSRVPGLYLAGGGVHPGPGVPMAALSGRLAAASLIADLTPGRVNRRVAIAAGAPTR